jgi:glycine/D-amino acid oxidase-like deaminating enzyme
VNDTATWGIFDAIKSVRIEEHVVGAITSLVKNAGLENEVDLVEGVRTNIFFTAEEEAEARHEYDAARAAGVDVSSVEWLSQRKVEEVRQITAILSSWFQPSSQTYGAHYRAVRLPGNTIWPVKLVTQLFKLAQNAPKALTLKLHTHTPITAVKRSPEYRNARRWTLETPRGSVECTHVVHATNAYASGLLPQLAGRTGIVPTRGQAIAVRAAVPARELTLSGFTADRRKDYWFVRPGSAPDERPLVILGGERLAEGAARGVTTDDSVIDPVVGARLRGFLPGVFPEKFERGVEPEMEWVRPMSYDR